MVITKDRQNYHKRYEHIWKSKSWNCPWIEDIAWIINKIETILMPAGLGKIKNIDTDDMNVLRNNSSSIKNGAADLCQSIVREW